MSSFNPPPPPIDPRWNRRALRQQQRAALRQAKWQAAQQRAQMRAAIRANRRHSLAGPLVLVALGALFLLGELGRVPTSTLAAWYGRWWPLLLIGIGVILLIEYARDRRETMPGVAPPRRSLGGVGTLAVVVIIVSGVGSMAGAYGIGWARDHLGSNDFQGLDDIFGHSSEATSELHAALAENGRLLVINPKGEISVTGSSTDGQIHITAKREAHGWDDEQLKRRLARLTPVLGGDDNQRTLAVPEVESSTANLEITVPRHTVLELRGRLGELNVQQMGADLNLTAGRAGANLSDIEGRVTLNGSDSDGGIIAHNVTGDMIVQGRTGDITVSDLKGSLSLHGNFFGTTELERIDGPVHFSTSRTDFQAARLDGELHMDTGSDMNATRLLGPVSISTHNRNIALDGVNGPVEITNRNGSVNVQSIAPAASVHIENKNGAVDLGLPEDAAVTLALKAHNGEISNDFGLAKPDGDNPALNTDLRGGGPQVTVNVNNGNLHLGHTSAQPWTHDAEPKLRTEKPPASPHR